VGAWLEKAAMANTPRIFISYARGDEAWAAQFVDELKAQGVEAWYDKTAIEFGDRWSEKMEQALRAAPVVAILLGPGSINNPWTEFELGAALAGNKKIIPILTQDVDREVPIWLPPLLRNRRLLREASPQAAARRVAEVVGSMMERDTEDADLPPRAGTG
jgi:hypothetical protein